jgi:hypothetical protein
VGRGGEAEGGGEKGVLGGFVWIVVVRGGGGEEGEGARDFSNSRFKKLEVPVFLSANLLNSKTKNRNLLIKPTSKRIFSSKSKKSSFREKRDDK